MKSAILFLFAVGLVIALTGCTFYESGNPRIEDSSIVEQVVQGTPRSEIRQLLGAPSRIEKDVDGKERWFYEHYDGWQPWVGPVFGTQTLLIVHFNIDDTVELREWSENDV